MFRESDDIIVNLTVTRRCYANCRGCINKILTFSNDSVANSPDCDPARDTQLVLKIADLHPQKTLTLCFYGGEPFLAQDEMEKIRRLLARSPAANRIRFMAYTTGELIGDNMAAHPELINGMWLYSVSVDGRPEQHAMSRPGTDLAKITLSLEKLRSSYEGHILFWSTLREDQSLLDCFLQFMAMYSSGLVNHMFWHWVDICVPYKDIDGYLVRYARELGQVMVTYLNYLSAGKLLPLEHVNELILYLLAGRERGHTACGVELAQNFDILDGVVHACADLPACIGATGRDGSVEIAREILNSLTSYKQELGCYLCEAHFYCGGRCPVQALGGSPERTRQICCLMRQHVSLVKDRIDEIRHYMERHHLSLQQVYDRSAFITRYTDVVP